MFPEGDEATLMCVLAAQTGTVNGPPAGEVCVFADEGVVFVEEAEATPVVTALRNRQRPGVRNYPLDWFAGATPNVKDGWFRAESYRDAIRGKRRVPSGGVKLHLVEAVGRDRGGRDELAQFVYLTVTRPALAARSVPLPVRSIDLSGHPGGER